MKHFRYYILPRLLLVLSIIAALFCLFFLWLSLDAPLPSPARGEQLGRSTGNRAPGRGKIVGKGRNAESSCQPLDLSVYLS